MFYFLKGMGNERLKNMTLDDYAKSDMIENNWLGELRCVLRQFNLEAIILAPKKVFHYSH